MLSMFNEAVTRLVAVLQREKGQALSEYGLILALVAIACVAALIFLAGALTGILNAVGGELTNAL